MFYLDRKAIIISLLASLLIILGAGKLIISSLRDSDRKHEICVENKYDSCKSTCPGKVKSNDLNCVPHCLRLWYIFERQCDWTEKFLRIHYTKKMKGFTLVEVLILAVIIALLGWYSTTAYNCYERGGTAVRGVFGFTCTEASPN